MGDGETNANLGDNMWDHDRADDNSEVDHTRSGGGQRTTGATGINIVVVDDRETNASLQDGVRDHNGPAMMARWTTRGAAVAME